MPARSGGPCPQRTGLQRQRIFGLPVASHGHGADNDCSGEIEADEEMPPMACWITIVRTSWFGGGSNVRPTWACSWDVGPGYSGNGVYCGCAGWIEFDYSESTPFAVPFGCPL